MDDGSETVDVVSKIQDLSDLELATLLCLVADQHCCIVQADEDHLDNVRRELELVYPSASSYIYTLADGMEDIPSNFCFTLRDIALLQ
jgi:hypothetical protein